MKKNKLESLKVFVYGTLQSGCVNHKVIPNGSIEAIQDASYYEGDLYMYTYGSFPCMVEGLGKVHGELITIKPEHAENTLERLDMLEGYYGPKAEFNFYTRKLIYVLTDEGDEECYAYFFTGKSDLTEKIEDGSFKNYIGGLQKWNQITN